MTITHSQPRTTVQVRFPDGSALDGPQGTTLEEFIKYTSYAYTGRAVAALINGQLRELQRPVVEDSNVVPITTTDSDGGRIYRRSLCFLMVAAGAELFPDDMLIVEHSMPFGGYYCERHTKSSGRKPMSDEELELLKNRMRELVAEDLQLTPIQTPLDEAVAIFERLGDSNKADLFSRRRKDYLLLYELNGVRDYMHGHMVPRTSYLDVFDLRHYEAGFILQFPRRQAPDELQPFKDAPRLAAVFQEYAGWLRVMGVHNVTGLNNAIEAERSKEVIMIAEALHQRQLSEMAAEIAARRPALKLVLISGPTSAGKTTFSKRLAVQLLAAGIHPVTLALDNYFVERDLTPRDASGEFDFEHFDALDTAAFQQHLRQLFDGETIIQPKFNFISGQREEGEPMLLLDDQILIVEGIHGLNPALVSTLPADSVYRIFISAFTQLNLDQHNRVPTTDTRLLRRIVRDVAHRGYSAADTIKRWPSIRRGEKNWIFPHQYNANRFFNSALVYEMAALKSWVEPLLLQVEPGTPERIEANRLLASLQWYTTIGEDCIPSDSILREFIGGSILDDFRPWHPGTPA